MSERRIGTVVLAVALMIGCAESPAAPPTDCDAQALRLATSEGEISARILGLVEKLRAAGAPAAYLREAVRGTQAQAVIAHVKYGLGVAPAEDPRPAALALLESIDPGLRAGEYMADPVRREQPQTTATNDIFWAWMLRVRVGDTPLPASAQGLPALTFGITRLAGDWQVEQITVEPALALAVRDDALAQVRCTPITPPDEARVRSHTFRGLLFVGCGPVGEYQYVPEARDRIDWREVVTWSVGPPSVAGDPTARARWIASRRATLTIDPANYFGDIAKADCYCHQVAGFTLAADAITGAVQRYWPGINCVVC